MIFFGLVIFFVSNIELINNLVKVVLPVPRSPDKKKMSPTLVFFANFFEKLFNNFKSHSNSNNILLTIVISLGLHSSFSFRDQ